MENFIILGIILIIVAAVSIYIYKAKKRGCKCIGCPHAGECKKKNTKIP